MASGAAKSTAFILLVLNLLLYFIVTVIAAWAVKQAIEETHETGTMDPIIFFSKPLSLFPIAPLLRTSRRRQGCCWYFGSMSYNATPFFTASILPIPARIFPIYFPMGNMATGFFVMFALLAGIIGMMTSATGLQDIARGTASAFHAAAASSLITLFLSLLAMGYCSTTALTGFSTFIRSSVSHY